MIELSKRTFDELKRKIKEKERNIYTETKISSEKIEILTVGGYLVFKRL